MQIAEETIRKNEGYAEERLVGSARVEGWAERRADVGDRGSSAAGRSIFA